MASIMLGGMALAAYFSVTRLTCGVETETHSGAHQAPNTWLEALYLFSEALRCALPARAPACFAERRFTCNCPHRAAHFLAAHQPLGRTSPDPSAEVIVCAQVDVQGVVRKVAYGRPPAGAGLPCTQGGRAARRVRSAPTGQHSSRSERSKQRRPRCQASALPGSWGWMCGARCVHVAH
jgi:hypothetical protein